MNIEQRLVRAFDQVNRIEPSTDLWSRVVHSIDEDHAHRRRVVWSIVSAITVLAGLIAVGAAFMRDGRSGPYVARPVMELLELVGLVVVVVVMGPAVRRFGRNYAHDLFPAMRGFASVLLRLLDLAYYLVFTGYILITTQFEFELGVTGRPASLDLAQQLREAAIRFGGLLLLIGVLHAAALVTLPVIALVHNSTRRGAALPRWLRNLGVILVALGVWQVIGLVVMLLVAGAS